MSVNAHLAFGGSGSETYVPHLDRAAHFRADSGWIATALNRGRFTPLWQGKVICKDDGHLLWLLSDHPLISTCEAPIFLGNIDGLAHFAFEIKGYTPTAIPSQLFIDESLTGHPLLPQNLGFQDLRQVMTKLTPTDAECAATAKALLNWHQSHAFCSACGQASLPSHAGWQRQCKSCNASHFPRTDPVAIMLITRGNNLLIGRSPQWPEGMYSLIAGFLEPGETLDAAVRREAFEETGIRVGAVRFLASQPWVFPASLMLGCIGEALSEDITIDPLELQDAQWISREDMARVQLGMHPSIKPSRAGSIAQFLISLWLSDRID